MAEMTTRKAATMKKSTQKETREGDLPARAAAATRRIAAWFQKRVNDVAQQLRPPVTANALAALAKAIDQPIPPELAAMWQVHDGIPIFEYAGLGALDAKRRYVQMEKLRKKGIFANHEVFEQSEPRIQPMKWHSAWIPLAEDGCGNLYCLDLDPGPAGKFGQVIKWEMAGGPFATSSVDLAKLLERYAKALESGKFKYDVDSGTYDGPFLDLLDK